jgi:hypothetical protein
MSLLHLGDTDFFCRYFSAFVIFRKPLRIIGYKNKGITVVFFVTAFWLLSIGAL